MSDFEPPNCRHCYGNGTQRHYTPNGVKTVPCTKCKGTRVDADYSAMGMALFVSISEVLRTANPTASVKDIEETVNSVLAKTIEIQQRLMSNG